MKKIKYLLLMCMLTFLLTGCVKFNANMDIKKDKSMNFSIIYAFDTSIFGDQQLLEEDDKKNLEKQGFTITDYSDNKMKGFTLSRKIKNIDEVSSTTDNEYNLSGILVDKTENEYIFKVKKGLFKNTYIAKFKFDASDSNLNDTADSSLSDLDIDTSSDGNNDLSWDSDISDSSSDYGDLSSMISNMDLSFNVTLPYSSKNNNASTTNNKNKNLSWDLSSNELENIEFEFELYNMNTIYACIGIIVLLVIIIVSVIVGKKNNNSKKKIYGSSINNQGNNYSTQRINPGLNNQNSSFAQIEQPQAQPQTSTNQIQNMQPQQINPGLNNQNSSFVQVEQPQAQSQTSTNQQPLNNQQNNNLFNNGTT